MTGNLCGIMVLKPLNEGSFITLEQFFREHTEAALGFSGGVDSSYLLHAGLRYGAKIKAYYVKTAFQPEFELLDAKKFAAQTGIELTIIAKNIFEHAQIVSNPSDRCYYCKKIIFAAIRTQAFSDGISLVLDGTNASDDASDRPGMKALTELSIRSPLRECNITKDDVRRFSKEAGLFTWDKPVYACLATRIPATRTITKELLQKIEKSEDILFSFGFTGFRVRVMGDTSNPVCAKIQLPQKQFSSLLDERQNIVKAIKQYFPSVLLDLEERNE